MWDLVRLADWRTESRCYQDRAPLDVCMSARQKRLAFKHRSAGSRHDMVMVVEVVRMTTRAPAVLGGGRDRQRPSYRDQISQQPMSSAQPIRCSY